MNSIKQFFSYMNDVSFPYVVLRNWDNLPYDEVLGEHSDLDLLVYDLDHWKEIFPVAKSEFPYPRVRMRIPIDDSYLYCDVRHVGDDYFPEDFEKAILATREFNPRGFYTPNPIHHRIALAYHAVHHKCQISHDYTRYLGDVSIDDLYKALKISNIGWVQPKDKSVGRFNGYWKGATSIVEKKENSVVKMQTGYCGYDLLTNEYNKLSVIDSIHFPKILSFLNNKLELEDCGVPILQALPEDWKEQMNQTMIDLEVFGIIHRDIRMDNILVKDGIVKLIDFGWAIFKYEKEDKLPPNCLGYPNKPSWGFDDRYSMKSTMRQIEYSLHEAKVFI